MPRQHVPHGQRRAAPEQLVEQDFLSGRHPEGEPRHQRIEAGELAVAAPGSGAARGREHPGDEPPGQPVAVGGAPAGPFDRFESAADERCGSP